MGSCNFKQKIFEPDNYWRIYNFIVDLIQNSFNLIYFL